MLYIDKYKRKKANKYVIFDVSFLIWAYSMALKSTCTDCSGSGCENCNNEGKVKFQNSKGKITGGIYGIINNMLSYIDKDYNPIFSFDTKREDLFRLKLLDDYKASRGDKPEFITDQYNLCLELFPLFTCSESYIGSDGESDDVMATLAAKLSKENPENQIIVITRDKDLYPLLTYNNIKIYRDNMNIDKEFFVKKYGFCPSRFNEYLAIAGDKIDNFDLFKGLGDKAAKDLISRTSHISELFDKNIWDNLPKKYKKILAIYDSNEKFVDFRKDDLKKSLKLATLDFNTKCIKINDNNNAKFRVKQLLENLELYNALKSIDILVKE